MIQQISQAAQGRMRWMVVEAETGQVVRESDWIKNLILNGGMDRVAVDDYCDLFLYAVAGTGVTPTADASGATTIAQSGTTVTLTGGAFTFTDTATDAGKVIKWDTTGEEATIVTVASPTSATVGNSATVANNTFVVYRTNQQGLTTEVKRTNTYLTGLGNCGSTLVGNVLQSRRTYDFTAEVGSVTYTEVGFSWSATPGNNLFSRILLPSPVALVAGQQLRLVYELWITITPTTSQAQTALINGWGNPTGVEQVAGLGLSTVNTSGSTSNSALGSTGNEPNVGSSSGVYLSTDSAAPASFNAGDNRTSNPVETTFTLGAYATGSYTRDKTAVFNLNSANRSDWRTMGYGMLILPSIHSYTATYNCFVFVFDSAQEKLNTHTLTLTFRWTWSRVLS